MEGPQLTHIDDLALMENKNKGVIQGKYKRIGVVGLLVDVKSLRDEFIAR
jgi:hypothetical protein